MVEFFQSMMRCFKKKTPKNLLTSLKLNASKKWASEVVIYC